MPARRIGKWVKKMTRLEQDEVVLGCYTNYDTVHVVTINKGVFSIHGIAPSEMPEGMRVLCAASSKSDEMLAGMARKLMEYKP